MFNRSSLYARTMAAAVTFAASFSAFAQQAQTFDARFAELIKSAKAEGAVTWYQGVLEQGGTGFAAHFQERFGIRVNHQFMPSGPIYERFKHDFVAQVQAMRVGDPADRPSACGGPGVPAYSQALL